MSAETRTNPPEYGALAREAATVEAAKDQLRKAQVVLTAHVDQLSIEGTVERLADAGFKVGRGEVGRLRMWLKLRPTPILVQP